MLKPKRLLVLIVLAISCEVLWAQEAADQRSDLVGAVLRVSDSISIGRESNEDALECLQGLVWKPTEFDAFIEKPTRADQGDYWVRFPSPIDSGNAINDNVALEWYAAKNEAGEITRARAVVVVHESGRGMQVGRLIARGLRQHGLHAFMIQLPHYGLRAKANERPKKSGVITMMQQAIADTRRARDVVSVLPHVDNRHIGLQGTSLGGFVAADVGSLDSAYDSVFVMLAGARLYELIRDGKKDAANVRRELEDAGIGDEQLKALAWTIEPTRIAHRLDPQRTWLFSGTFDQVVPPKHAYALAKAAKLDDKHHVPMLANHYTGVVFLPYVLDQIRIQVTTLDERAR